MGSSRRLGPTLLVALLLMAACGGSSEVRPFTDPSTSTSTANTTTVPLTPSTSALTRSSVSSASTSTTSTTTLPQWQKYPTIEILPLSAPGEPVARVARVDTTDRVVFLTIDDGFHRDPQVPEFLAAHHMPASLFLVRGPVLEDPEYFRSFLASGSTINSHTLNHPELPELGYEHQRSEICGMVDLIRRTYGTAGALFRPPYGSSNADTRRAAAACGLAAVVTWNSELWEGNVDLARRPNLQPGDIFLTHFRPDLLRNLEAFFWRVASEGFTVALLDRYLVSPFSGE